MERKPDLLEAAVKEETDNLLRLKHIIDKDTRDRVSRKKGMIVHSREAKFYTDKVENFDMNQFERRQMDLKLVVRDILNKRDELEKLRKSLQAFDNLEPSNEALKRKIDELQRSRLSLEMTFVDDN